MDTAEPLIAIRLSSKQLKFKRSKKSAAYPVFSYWGSLNIQIYANEGWSAKPVNVSMRFDTATDLSSLPREKIKQAALEKHAGGQLTANTVVGAYASDVFLGSFSFADYPTIRCKAIFGAMPRESLQQMYRRIKRKYAKRGESERQGLLSLHDLLQRFDVAIFENAQDKHYYLGLSPRPPNRLEILFRGPTIND